MLKKYYFDYSAATPVDQRVVKAMEKYSYLIYGNPSSLHEQGRLARQALEESRQKIANLLDVNHKEIYFTSGGTESDNWAMLGVARGREKDGKKIIISSIEHKAIIQPAKYLQEKGWQVDVCPVREDGLLDLEKLEKLIDKETVLISVIYANNEIGVVQDLPLIKKIIKKKNSKAYLHTDACQAVNFLEIRPEKLGVDLMTINSSKIYGPRGIGALYIKKGLQIEPLIMGGGQERQARAGTENVAGAVGVAEAMDIARKISVAESRRLYFLREKIISTVTKEIKDVYLNGSRENRLPNNINFSFAGIEGESLVLYLDDKGIMASTGSACGASDLDPSHVLLALGRKKELAHGSLRITLGRWTSEEAVDYLLEVLPVLVDKIRKMSAIYK